MTIAYFCVLIMMFIPLLAVGYAKFSKGTYDNRSPRDFLEKLEDGKAKRAHYAQLNSYEAFPPFAAAVIIAHQIQAPQHLLDILAVSFIVVRSLYVYFYIVDKHVLRSTAWFIGLFITVSIFFIGI